MSVTYSDGIVFNATNTGAIQFVDNGYASTAFVLLNSALVFIMIPGVAFFYSGLSPQKSALTIIFISILSSIVVTMQWLFFGFSLSFSETGSQFFGDASMFGLVNVGPSAMPFTAPAIPSIAFCLYQLQFAGVTAAIIFGSVAERIRILPAMVFVFLWTTFVYDVVAYWTWSHRGWLKNLSCLGASEPCHIGAFDFAGGGPVHIASGFSGLAYCLVVGKRKSLTRYQAHNLNNVILGTSLLWFGWFGFNGGSSLSSTTRAAMAATVTIISAAFGGISWALVDLYETKRFSVGGTCSGIIAGLVTITPASGFVAPWAGAVIGIIGGAACNFACRIKSWLNYDDALDGFGIHGVGGFIGCILTGIFHQKYITAFDATTTFGGAIDGYGIGVGYQLVEAVTIAAWSFVVTGILLKLIDLVPSLSIKVSEDVQTNGLDFSQFSEFYKKNNSVELTKPAWVE